MELYGKKVRLRAVEPEDLEMLRTIKNDAEIEKCIVGWSYPISVRQQQQWYESYLNNNNQFFWIIETKEEGPVGYARLGNINWQTRTAQPGGVSIINSKYMSKGIATDAYMTLLKFAFFEMNLHRINESILDFNIASQKLFEKVGYKREGVKRKAVYKNGEYHDLIIYGILKEDYIEKIKETDYWD